MQPAVALPWSPVENDDHLLDAAPTPAYNISTAADTHINLTESIQTESSLQHHELRKRQPINEHTVPWGMQTGPTKYAPMPKRAGSTIATTSPTPQYPPFPFSIATTFLGMPTVRTTLSEYLTATVHSIENTVCCGLVDFVGRWLIGCFQAPPAPQPTLDKRMQMWVDRWKD